MYSHSQLARVQDYILRNPNTEFFVFHNPSLDPPELIGEGRVTIRTSPYVQRGAVLVIDRDGVHADLARRLIYDDLVPVPTQHQLFTADDLQGLAAREAQQ